MDRERLIRIDEKSDMYFDTQSGAIITKANRKEFIMITLLQQGKIDKNNFIGVEDRDKATHFNKDGVVFNISELEEEKQEAAMDLPALDFSTTKHQDNQKELEMHEVGAAGEEQEALDVPQW